MADGSAKPAAKPAAAKKPAPKLEVGPVNFSADGRRRRAFTIRAWSVRHSRFLEWLYQRFAGILEAFHFLFAAVGYDRAERPVSLMERSVKGFMFDCRMCGQCVLSSTGMSCPMNCPKQLRNGPCGGVRADGNCEVIPEAPCVWVKAWEGSRQMQGGDAILNIQKPVSQAQRDTSSWLRVTREAAAKKEAKA
jgi:hypothetical protein